MNGPIPGIASIPMPASHPSAPPTRGPGAAPHNRTFRRLRVFSHGAKSLVPILSGNRTEMSVFRKNRCSSKTPLASSTRRYGLCKGRRLLYSMPCYFFLAYFLGKGTPMAVREFPSISPAGDCNPNRWCPACYPFQRCVRRDNSREEQPAASRARCTAQASWVIPGRFSCFGAIAVLYFTREILIPFAFASHLDVHIDSRGGASPEAAHRSPGIRSHHGPAFDGDGWRHRLDHRESVGGPSLIQLPLYRPEHSTRKLRRFTFRQRGS